MYCASYSIECWIYCHIEDHIGYHVEYHNGYPISSEVCHNTLMLIPAVHILF